MSVSPNLEELNHLYERLSPEQRDELLQSLLIAAPRGGEAVLKVLEDELLCHATEELFDEHAVVAGADGCAAGWFVILRHLSPGETTHHRAADFGEVLALCAQASVIALDIPIGLLDTVKEGGRPVDRLARARLSPYRVSSVFSAPCRPALAYDTYEEAAAATKARSITGRSLTRQAFGLFPKLRDVDGFMTPQLQEKVREVHPELCFAAMNGGRPLSEYKKTPEGRARRVRLLQAAGFGISEASVEKLAKSGVERDDVLDAYAACWTAARIARGKAERISEDSVTDSRGLRMEMWF